MSGPGSLIVMLVIVVLPVLLSVYWNEDPVVVLGSPPTVGCAPTESGTPFTLVNPALAASVFVTLSV
jgi:hypothetical protein